MNLIQQTISGADGKASILGTSGAVVVGLVASSLDLTALRGGSPMEAVHVVFGLVTLGCVVLVGVELAGVLVPRVKPAQPSRYAWPWIVSVDLEALVATEPRTERREAWAQVQMLAQISARKHRHLRRAISWFAAAVAAATVWALLGASLG